MRDISCVPPCRAGAALPGRFAETLDSGPPQDNWKLFFKVAWTTSTFFLLGRIHLGAGSAGLLCRAGAAGGFSSRVVRRSAREFEVYDMVVHFRMSGNDSLDVICSMLCAFAAPEAQDHEQGGAQVGHGGVALAFA